CMQAFQTPYSF
nr:immunoglobulin light chain junction region [Macaca mulatta]MOV34035.1 immunoglobulin light chain junction region [Macaca mulatta]MOV34045.1 immunoglobulin light chain junction region [Macaca mulatta]MOV34087.1 immunoglobulin light chain junction region [Macaca mulatta]MOV34107.1 immunoglobulin light chain junction region [Macaca mulatta]